jgi:type IV pilus assembly protein PilF
LPDCRKAVALDPRNRDGHTNLGVVYAALNRAGEAEASYRRALAIDPRNGDANYNYGVLLLVTNRRDEARDYLGRGCDARVADACELLSNLVRAR